MHYAVISDNEQKHFCDIMLHANSLRSADDQNARHSQNNRVSPTLQWDNFEDWKGFTFWRLNSVYFCGFLKYKLLSTIKDAVLIGKFFDDPFLF